ncbi:MAG: type II toxin-antitoxin system PemK/MazF family toxin [Armatimonadota bacterium]
MTISQGDIFVFDFGYPTDNRQAGIRPAVIVQTDLLNTLETYGITMVVPVSTKGKEAVPSHILIEPEQSNGLSQRSFAKCEQVHIVSKSSLGRQLGSVSKSQLYLIKGALKDVFAII